MNVTDKDREEAQTVWKALTAQYGDVTEKAAIEIARIRAESAEQARKEALNEAVLRLDIWICRNDPELETAEMEEMVSAILGDTPVNEPKQTDAEKLAIVVKSLRWALEYIGDGHLPDEGTPDHVCGYEISPDNGHCDFCENYWNAREIIEKQKDVIIVSLAVLEAKRAELEGYEAQASGEKYNSPSLNSIIEKLKGYA